MMGLPRFSQHDSNLRLRHAALAMVISAIALMVGLVGAGTAAPAGKSDLKVSKTDSPDPVTVGSTLTYTIRVENLGPDPATGVTVTDQLPKEVDFVSATSTSGKCSRKGRKVTCAVANVGLITYGAAPLVTITVIPRKAGTITNTASASGDQADPAAANNTATATTLVLGAVTCRGATATVVGTPGNDTLTGTGGRDVIAALGGNDTISTFAGNDLVCAGAGRDYVGSGSAADRVFGGAGMDRLLGRGGPDVLKGNAGNDVLKGNRGDDRLRGGSGVDRCRGGAGMDSLRSCER